VALGLARSYQLTRVFGRLSVRDNLALALQAREGVAASLGVWRPARREAARHAAAEALAERLGLDATDATPAARLSHGQQRRLDLALALACQPRVLLLDEPLAGLGPEESASMAALLTELGAAAAVLLVEHDMDTVFRIADQVSALVGGRVIASGSPALIRAHPEVQRAYLGDDAGPAAAAGAEP